MGGRGPEGEDAEALQAPRQEDEAGGELLAAHAAFPPIHHLLAWKGSELGSVLGWPLV